MGETDKLLWIGHGGRNLAWTRNTSGIVQVRLRPIEPIHHLRLPDCADLRYICPRAAAHQIPVSGCRKGNLPFSLLRAIGYTTRQSAESSSARRSYPERHALQASITPGPLLSDRTS